MANQDSTGNKIDVYEQRGNSIIHKQVEHRDGRLFFRLKKTSITGALKR